MKKISIAFLITGILVFLTSIVLVLCAAAKLLLSQKPAITISKAEELYNSDTFWHIGNKNSFNSQTLLEDYKYEKIKYSNIECYVFDIKDSDMKLYGFQMPNCNTTFLSQTVFVSEQKENNTLFEIGDNIEVVRKEYPDIILFKNDRAYFEDTEKVIQFFEILNGNIVYSYGLNKNGNIVIIEKVNIETMKDVS